MARPMHFSVLHLRLSRRPRENACGVPRNVSSPGSGRFDFLRVGLVVVESK
jgi:hypothetical protein